MLNMLKHVYIKHITFIYKNIMHIYSNNTAKYFTENIITQMLNLS